MTIQGIDDYTTATASAARSSIGTRVIVLAAMASVGSFATSILLPSLSSIAKSLNVSTAAVALAISIYLAVFAVGQLVVGPLSDRYGRWKPVVFGLAIFVLGSVWCEFSTNLTMLLIGRSIQAIGACAASALSRAIARDLMNGEDLTRAMAFIMVAMSAAPGFSPLIGGILEATSGWRSAFFAVGLFGALVIAAYVKLVGETHRPNRRASLQLTSIARGYVGLFTDIRFIAPAGTLGLFMGAIFAMFSGSPRVIVDGLGFSGLQLGLFFAGTVFAAFGAGMAAPRLAKRIGHSRATLVGIAITVAGTLMMLAQHWVGQSIWSYIASVLVFLSGFGMAVPLGTATALQPFGERAGLASALVGFLQMAGAAIGAALTASIADASLAVGVVQVAFAVSGLVLYYFGTRTPVTEK